MMFTSLANRNYRWFWLAQVAGFAALMMGMVARSWLVWTISGSAFAIGVVSFTFGLPLLLLAVFGGAVVDKVPKRGLLIVTQIHAFPVF